MCPPGVDQTTRVTQQWQILAPRLQQIHQLKSSGTPSRVSFPIHFLLSEDSSWGAWSKLARPVPAANRQITRRHIATRRIAPSQLESMPAEILAMILSCPELLKDDIISLGLASETLWLHAFQHIEAECHRFTVAPWAGTEVACIGTYLTDLPESFDKDDLAKDSVTVYKFGQMCMARKINWAAKRAYQDPGEAAEVTWQRAFQAQAQDVTSIPDSRLSQMSDDIYSISSRFGVSYLTTRWVLRNLTTREFVYCVPKLDAHGKRGCVDYPNGDWLSIDDAIMMRTCWTCRSLTYDGQEVDLNGPWAGHCFDIVALDEDKSVTGDEWIDATEAVVDEAQQLLNPVKENRSDSSDRLKT